MRDAPLHPLKVATFLATPRFATGYTPLRNRAGLLIETHMLKPYKSRVRGTYDVLRYSIEEIGKTKQSLFEANRQAEAETLGPLGSRDCRPR